MHIAIPLAVIVGLIPVIIAITGEGLFRWLSLACAALMLFGLVAPPAALIAWCMAMLFAAMSRQAFHARIERERAEKLRAKEELTRAKEIARAERGPLLRLPNPFKKKE